MRRRTIIPILAVVAFSGVLLSRCDPRSPGEAAALGPDVRLDPGIVRRDLRFSCGDAQCAGWLYLPDTARPAPVVVMAHGFSGTRDVGLPAMALRLARSGFAAFVFDYRYFGASGGLPRQVVDPPKQLDDWRAALRFVRSREEVDAERVALLGSSLGGGHALIVAAGDPKLRAVIARAPLVDSSTEGEATFFGVGWVVRLLLTGWADLFGSAFGRDPILIPAIAPGSGFGMIVDDTAYGAFEKLVEPGSTYRNAVAARSPFLFDDYDPAAHTAAITAPVLLIASRSDRFAPFAAVESYRSRAPNVEVATFDGDHFDVYVPPAATQAEDAAVEFLERHLR
jgi:pimeloyl-ACP methyl ester carboxylesterase